MRIKHIVIQNFKRIKELKYNCNQNFNYIVGENNAGKSTIFESIRLWKLAFDEIIISSGKRFYSSGSHRYLGFSHLHFLRLKNDNDIFNQNWSKELSIELGFSHEENEFNLKISLEKSSISNSYFRIKYDDNEFKKFADKIIELELSLRDSIYIYQTHPIFHSIKNEPFYNNAQLLKKISIGKSHEVIRNKILKSVASKQNFDKLEGYINRIFNTHYKIRLKNKNRQDDEYVNITFQNGNEKEIEISLMGSGLIQVIDIFSTIEFIIKRKHCLNILLIDEPDSHLHSNIQSKLIDELKNNTDNQTFIISHNDRLINKAEEGELFFINNKAHQNQTLNSLDINSYNSVSAELANELLNISETHNDKIIVLTEGKTDKKILEVAWEKLFPTQESPFCFIASGIELDLEKRAGNADTVRRTCELISSMNPDLRIIGLFDNDKEGNCQFRGLNKKIFEPHDITKQARKHLQLNIFGMLLPIIENRKSFVTNNINHRYLVIEHFFDDFTLKQFNLKGESILGTEVFEINEGNKNNFSNSVVAFDKEKFENFHNIFDDLKNLFIEA